MSHHDHDPNDADFEAAASIHGQPPPPLQVELDLEFPVEYRVVHYHEIAPEIVAVLNRSLDILEPVMSKLSDAVDAVIKAVVANQATVADLRKQIADLKAEGGMPASDEDALADKLTSVIDGLDGTNSGTLPTPTPTPTPSPTDTGNPPAPPSI